MNGRSALKTPIPRLTPVMPKPIRSPLLWAWVASGVTRSPVVGSIVMFGEPAPMYMLTFVAVKVTPLNVMSGMSVRLGAYGSRKPSTSWASGPMPGIWPMSALSAVPAIGGNPVYIVPTKESPSVRLKLPEM